MLSLSFLDSQFYCLAWFAFLPLLFSIQNATLLTTYFIGVFAGFVLFVSATTWIFDFLDLAIGGNGLTNLALTVLYWFYCSHIIALPLVLFNWLKNCTNISDTLLFPVLLTTAISAFPMVFPMRLGDTQVDFKTALQAVEFLGVHSLDAIIALVNITLFNLGRMLFLKTGKDTNQSVISYVMSGGVVALWFIYGIYAYQTWERTVEGWDAISVGIVQPNEIPSRTAKIPEPGYSLSYPPEIEMTERLASDGADIVIWPEASQKYYFDNKYISQAYQRIINDAGVSLIFQDNETVSDGHFSENTSTYNSAAMLDSEGELVGLYKKVKRIPIGEYIPLLSDSSRLRYWIENYLGVFYSDLSASDEYGLFEHSQVNFIPLICYETTIPDYVASTVGQAIIESDSSKGSILVGLSNDGWFNSIHQAHQHVMPSVLRAIENRLPLIHVVNNGPSIVVTPHGQIAFKTPDQVAGGFITSVSYASDTRGSLYSRYPRLFPTVLYSLTLVFLLMAIKPYFSKL